MAATKKTMKKSGKSVSKTKAKKAVTKKPSKSVQKTDGAKRGSVKKTPAKKAPAKKKAAVKPAAAKPAAAKAIAPKKSAAKSTPKSDAPSLIGKKAPSFRLQDQSGAVVTSSSLKGKPYVLYFYPKDNTPGCTRESCEFRDDERNFRAAGVTILGVSPDSVKSHAGFASKFELPFPLLSDPEKELAQAYGVWALKKNYGREYWGIVRSTFLVDQSGKVTAEWRQVKVNGHVAEVLGQVKK